jgi:hypothetical protein
MNKPLIRAAAVINIVAASLIYIACSGDDGKDGKDGCIIAKNASGDYDVTCSGAYIGTISQSGGGGGGSCSAAPLQTGNGGVILTCDGTDYIIQNGAPGQGGGPGGGCSTELAEAPAPSAGAQLYGDKVIQITCGGTTQASILVCPAVSPTAVNGSNGLLFNTDGQLGRCTAQGLIVRTEQKVLNCGGVMFDPKKEFCQRTLTANSSTTARDSGFFASYSTSQQKAIAQNYPERNYSLITEAESAYNLAGNEPNVLSQVRPLCGVTPVSPSNNNTTDIQNIHTGGGNLFPAVASTGSVYNALQYCGRNLVFKAELASDYYTSGINIGKIIDGGPYDNNATSPASKSWTVLPNGQCYVGLKETNPGFDGSGQFGINGFTFTGTSNTASATAPCDFVGAPILGTVPYVVCPADKPLVSLDNVKCAARTECLYHSTIDNTCLISNQPGSLFGKTTYDQAYIAPSGVVTSGTGTPTDPYVYAVTATFDAPGVTNPTTGIYRTTLGSRPGLGTSPNALQNRNGNMWSKACATSDAGRFGYYAVNDPHLTNKKWKDEWQLTPPTVGIPVPPPICGGTDFDGNSVTAVPFDDAFACTKGSLSVYVPALQGAYDGQAWNKPLYCVQTNFTGTDVSSEGCYLYSGEIARDNCGSDEVISVLAGTSTITIGNGNSIWVDSDNSCKVEGVTKELCPSITKATIQNSTLEIITSQASIPSSNPSGFTGFGLVGAMVSTDCVITGTLSDVSTNPATNTSINTSIVTGSAAEAFCLGIKRGNQIGATSFNPLGDFDLTGTVSGNSCIVTSTTVSDISTVCAQLTLIRSNPRVPGGKTVEGVTASWK